MRMLRGANFKTMSIIKEADASEVNDLLITGENSVDFIDKATGTMKRKYPDGAGGVAVRNVLGAVQAGVVGQVILVAGQIQVVINVLQPLKTVGIFRQLPNGNAGFLSFVIDIPGGPGVPAQFTINSTSGADTSTVDYIAYEEQE